MAAFSKRPLASGRPAARLFHNFAVIEIHHCD
jgi:hypothetical protein